MATLEIGGEPHTWNVVLRAASDFTPQLEYLTGSGVTDWPSGTVLSIHFNDGSLAVWTATIVGSVAYFDVDKEQTALIPRGTRVRWQYTNGTSDQAIAFGRVKRYD